MTWIKSKPSKRIFLNILSCLLAHASMQANELSNHEHGKGYIPSSQEQLKKIEQTWSRIVKVKPNEIGAIRIQEDRKKKNLHAQEIKTATHKEEFIKAMGACQLHHLQDAGKDAQLPSHVDNTILPCFPPIGDQQQEGSCVAWGSTYYQTSHELGLLNGYDNKASFDHVLSPRWTYNLLNGGNDGGLVPHTAFSLLAQNGAVSINAFPYVNGDVTSWDLNPQDWISALSNRMASAHYVTGIGGKNQNLQTIKQLLTNGHILTFATFIDSWVFTTISDDPDNPTSPYIGQQACTYMNGMDGGHFMTIVGYDDNLWIDVNGNGEVDSGERGAFLIANSWGTSWGNNGLIWISYDAFLDRSAVANGPSDNRIAAASAENNYVFSVVPKTQNYTPSLIGQFTLNQSYRNQISVQAGSSNLSHDKPMQTFDCYALMNQGGPLEFDGTQPGDPEQATFAVDMTDLLNSSTPEQRYYLLTSDNTEGHPTVLTAFNLLDLTNNQQVSYPGVPLQCDHSQMTPYIDYTFPSHSQIDGPNFAFGINCGGKEIAYNGIDFQKDRGYSSLSNTFAKGGLSHAPLMYRTERNGTNFAYHLNVPNGQYLVTLHFAELIYKQPGRRMFNVDINGSRVATSLDLCALAGYGVPLDLQFPVTVSKGMINIHFAGVYNKAKINAIHCVKVD